MKGTSLTSYLMSFQAAPKVSKGRLIFIKLLRHSMKDFGEIFDLGPNFFDSHKGAVTRETFLEDLSGLHLNFKTYEKCRPTITALTALQSDNEKEAILSVLSQNPNIDSYILDHLESESVFYLVSRKFFDAWCDKAGFGKSHSLKREERDLLMDN